MEEKRKAKVQWVMAKVFLVILLPFFFVGIALGMIWQTIGMGFRVPGGVDEEANFWKTMAKRKGE